MSTVVDPSFGFGRDPSVGQSRLVTVPFWKVHSAFGKWSATPDMAMADRRDLERDTGRRPFC